MLSSYGDKLPGHEETAASTSQQRPPNSPLAPSPSYCLLFKCSVGGAETSEVFFAVNTTLIPFSMGAAGTLEMEQSFSFFFSYFPLASFSCQGWHLDMWGLPSTTYPKL